jgi:hypothetical protein
MGALFFTVQIAAHKCLCPNRGFSKCIPDMGGDNDLDRKGPE